MVREIRRPTSLFGVALATPMLLIIDLATHILTYPSSVLMIVLETNE